jgi:hypothetical protein
MKIKIQTLGLAALLPAVVLTLASCSSEPEGNSTSTTTTQPGVPGGTTVNTYQETATVTGINAATREVTLVTPDGAKSTITCGPDVANFAQIQAGDQVKATVIQQLVVSVRQPGEPANDGGAGLVALAPIGAKPGVVMAHTMEITAKVQAIDLTDRKATLLFPDGTTKSFKVREDVDLTKQTVGSDVVFRVTEGVAILVEKP